MENIIKGINFVLNMLFKVVIAVGVFAWLTRGTDAYTVAYIVEIVMVVAMTVLTIMKEVIKEEVYKEWTVCN